MSAHPDWKYREVPPNSNQDWDIHAEVNPRAAQFYSAKNMLWLQKQVAALGHGNVPLSEIKPYMDQAHGFHYQDPKTPIEVLNRFTLDLLIEQVKSARLNMLHYYHDRHYRQIPDRPTASGGKSKVRGQLIHPYYHGLN